MKMTSLQAEEKVSKAGFTMLEYGNACKAKSTFKCRMGHVWISTVHRVCNVGDGCPKCPKRPPIPLSEACKRSSVLGVILVEYGGAMRKHSTFMCVKCNKTWNTKTSNVLNDGKGCPHCSSTGFKKDMNAYLYTLISNDKTLIKIGITGNIKKRIRYLKQNTPFSFCLHSFEEMKGEEAIIKEKSFHETMISAQLSGFNGCTEWFINTKDY